MRNTPDPDCNLSPAQIIFGRPIRDSLSFVNRLEKYTNPHIKPIWREAWSAKENALRTRFSKTSETLNEHVKPLLPLKIGDKCFIQNQTGNNPTKWHRTGTVVETAEHDQYIIKVDGSGRLTKRNRRFLRGFKPASQTIENTPLKDTLGINEWKANQTDHRSAHEPTITSPPESLNETIFPIPPPNPPMLPPETGDRPPSVPDQQIAQTPSPNHTPDKEPTARAPKVPAILRRIQSYNSDGLKEDLVTPENNGRRNMN